MGAQGISVMTMLYDHLIRRAQDKRERDQRFAEVRAALSKLLPDEKEEFIVELLAEMSPGDAPRKGRNSSTVSTAPTREPVDTVGDAQRVYATKPDGYTIAHAIADAVRDRKPRTTREIALATKSVHAWVNEGSVPAAVARMGTMDPPLQLVQQGENDRGYPLYVLAPTETSP